MILHRKCAICGSEHLKGFAIDTIRRGPHISRVKCIKCGVVFANPMADRDDLKEFYSGYYDVSVYKSLGFKDHSIERLQRISTYTRDQVVKEAPYIGMYDLEDGDKTFLDVGCGLGLGLAYANRLGYKLYATEFDADAIQFVRSYFDVDVFEGELLDSAYPDNFFDYIHISHVIEHVLDPRAYIAEMRRILKPGGILYIATPNINSSFYSWYRAACLLTLKVPRIIDGLEHTFVFPKKLLAEICREEGFTIREHRGVSIGETIANLKRYQMPLGKKLGRYAQNFFHVNQWLTAQKSL